MMDLQKYNDINIAELLLRAGYELKTHDSHGQLKVVGQGGLIIQPATGLYNHFSEGVGGKGAINLIMHLKKCDFKEAISRIDSYMDGNLSTFKKYGDSHIIKETADSELKRFVLPARNDNNDKVIKYLTEKRKLNKNLVLKMIEADLLYETKKYHNCIFICRDFKGNVVGAVKRGSYDSKTKEPFKGLAINSNGNFGVTISKFKDYNSEELYVFEGVIDLLSYIQMNEQQDNITYLSMNGLKVNLVMNYIDNIKNLQKIVLCTDNDKMGQNFIQNISKKINEYNPKLQIDIKRSNHKDWNEDLLNYHYPKTDNR